MKASNNILDRISPEKVAPVQILRSVLDAWEDGRLSEAADPFADPFTFTDHALGLELQNKGRLIEFFEKTWELFPDFEVRLQAAFTCGEQIISEWTFSATHTKMLPGRVLRRAPIFTQGVSIVQIRERKIRHWADYYDRLTPRREALAAFF